MALIQLYFGKPSPTEEDPAPNDGKVRFTPTAGRTVEGSPDMVVLPVGFTVSTAGGRADVHLATSGPGWVWEICVYDFGVRTEYVYVIVPEAEPDPDNPGEFLPVDYPDLIRVDPASLEPSAEPDPAWWAELEAAKALAADVEAARVDAAGSALESGAARDDAVAAAGESEASAVAAVGSAVESGTSAGFAAGHAVAAGSSAVASAGSASGAAGSAVEAATARDATVAAADGSEAAAGRAEVSAAASAVSAGNAESAAAGVVARADSGEFKGDQGLPGNATMRVDTTVGTRIFITDGVTERMISGDTGPRLVSTADMATGWGEYVAQYRITVQREGPHVTIRGSATAASGNASLTLFTLPAGFRPKNVEYAVMFNSSGLYSARLSIGGDGVVASRTALNGLQVLSTITFVTGDPWPTTLPFGPA